MKYKIKLNGLPNWIAFLGLFLASCAWYRPAPGFPGWISTSTSEFDAAKEYRMEPAWVGDLKLGLFKRSTMPQDEIILIAMVKGAKLFSPGKSLHFNIDGEIVDFASIDTFTDIETDTSYSSPVNWSSKRYRIDKSFLERILKAKRVIVRLDLEKTYVEGIFSTDGDLSIGRPAFKNFYHKVFGELK